MCKEDLNIGEYHLPGDTTTGAALFDDPHYSNAGVSNNHYLHLENAVTRGVDTEYSKLGCDGSTSSHRHNMNNPYRGVPPATDSGSNMPPSCDKQGYSTLSHHPALFTNGDDSHKLSHNDTTWQEYSTLNHHSGQPTTHTDSNKSTEQQYSSLQHTTMFLTSDDQ